MLYPKNKEDRLSPDLFLSPTAEYRGTPFWAWNGKLEDETLKAQIEGFKAAGLGGFHMHVRTGLDTPYLSREYLDAVQTCIDKAKAEGLLAWMYDEDRWPSGTCGGRVTDGHPEFARKTLMLTVDPYTDDRPHAASKPEPGRGQISMRQDNGELIAIYDVQLNADGTLKAVSRVSADAPTAGTRWYAYMEHAADDPWFNDHPYVDTLDPAAIRSFLDKTHEIYAERFSGEFGKTVPAIFTDEPQFSPKDSLSFAREEKDIFLPWTTDLDKAYENTFGESLMDRLPELIWELPDGQLSPVRWRFQNLVADRFATTYCAAIGRWCDEHGLALTGHVNAEDTLDSQTQYVGDAMRCYPAFGIPGIDMLCDFHNYNTAKQTQSVVRQCGKEGMMSELYGVTGWDYDFRGYKLQGDWQAALGVTVRVPHLAWMTMHGEAKRDYPACINYQSPWWPEYSMIEDHYARLNTAMTRGRACCRVGVIHPVESYWLHWGPSDQTTAARSEMDNRFASLTETLLFGGIDFDFLSEALLPELCPAGAAPLPVGQMRYDTVIVPAVDTLRSTTVERLHAFLEAGGRLIFQGRCPALVDALPSEEIRMIYEKAEHLSTDPAAVLEALEPERFLDIRHANGSRSNQLLHQLRRDGSGYWLFLCNGKNPVSPDVDPQPLLRFTVKGKYEMTEYDTLSGEIRPLAASREDGHTVFHRIWHMHDSLLLRLEPASSDAAEENAEAESGSPSLSFGTVPVTRSEPNMLLLDMAEYALNDGPWQPVEELLRLDNAARRALGIPLRRKEIVQPYLLPKDEPTDTLKLRFTVLSDIHCTGLKLGLEDETEIVWNGVSVPFAPDGWFVDRCIRTVPLPDAVCGTNELIVTVPIGPRTNLEYFYLLGDFGVAIQGTEKRLTAPVSRLGWGDIVPQQLPFYTGNLDYHVKVVSDGDFTVRVPQYRGGLIKVSVDGKEAGRIAFSPYTLPIHAEAGEHDVTLTLYGTRQNGFAQLHHTQGVYFYQSANSWRSAGDLWSYEYRFKPAGILKSPEFYGASVISGSGVNKARAADHMSDQS